MHHSAKPTARGTFGQSGPRPQAGTVDVGTGLDSTPLELLYFPDVATDVVVHLAATGVWLVAFFAQLGRDRDAAPRTTGA